PAWAAQGGDIFDVLAKAEGDEALTQERARALLRRLLADRFRLEVRREVKEMPVYVLSVAPSGTKFKPTSENRGPASIKMADLLRSIIAGYLDHPLIDQ